MTKSDAAMIPKRGKMHEAFAIFLGDWKAKGTSYGGTDQSGADPARQWRAVDEHPHRAVAHWRILSDPG